MAKALTLSTVFTSKDKLTKPAERMVRNIEKSFGSLATKAKKITGNFAKFGAVAGGVAALGIKKMVDSASLLQDATAGFTPLMGSVSKATKLVDRLNKTAATTPFQFENLSNISKQILPVMNGDIDKTIKTVRMLGDTAGGNSQKMESIARGYSKAMLKGKVDMESLNMIAEAGVPIYTELSDSMGVSVKEMMKMSSAGKISSNDLTNAFDKMTSKGGIFFKGMEISSQTFSGRLSTLKDNITMLAAKFGAVLLPILGKYIIKITGIAGKMSAWADSNQDLIKEKVAEFVEKITGAFEKLLSIATALKSAWDSGLIPAIIAGVAAFKLATAAIGIYQTIMAAIPVIQAAVAAGGIAVNATLLLIPTAIALVVAGLVLMVKHWDKVVDVLKKVGVFFKKVGQTALKWILLPINGIIDAVQGVLSLASKIPGIGNKIGAFSDKIGSVQDKVNKTLIGTSGTNDFMGIWSKDTPVGSNTTTTNKSELQVNFANAPIGTSTKQTGSAPGITVNMGQTQPRP